MKMDDHRPKPTTSSRNRREFLRYVSGAGIGLGAVAVLGGAAGCRGAEASVHIVPFAVDATPEIGQPLAHTPAKTIEDRLSCRGLVILGDKAPIVLCALDWIGVSNEGHSAFRRALADAADTTPERVAVHCLHQHESCTCDFSALEMARAHGVEDVPMDELFARGVIRDAAEAVEQGLRDPIPVTHIGTGQAKVERIASNRQLLGKDGKVLHVRFSSTDDPAEAEAPEGLIDPFVKIISFWNEDEPVGALSYYATHPQLRPPKGRVTCDFVGIARNQRQEATGVFHTHFNGAAGNITAGKYNDGSPELRSGFVDRMRTGLDNAWANTTKEPIAAGDVGWNLEHVVLPPAERLSREDLIKEMLSEPSYGTGGELTWVHRCNTGQGIDLTCLELGSARVLHMPGELFVEYQLSAQSMRPDLFVAMAAYGDDAPGYIGTRDAYPKGGYEVGSPSDVSPEVESVLEPAMRRLLEAPDDQGHTPSEYTAKKPLLSAPEED